MAKTKRQGGGAKLARSETVTVRLDPRLRYLAELAAAKQRRTLSSYIEWAVEHSLDAVVMRMRDAKTPVTAAQEAEKLWDVEESERFVKLASSYPDLLNHDQEKLWKLIQRTKAMWQGYWEGTDYVAKVQVEYADWTALREHWPMLRAVARGEALEAGLPQPVYAGSYSESMPDLDEQPPF